MLQPPKRPPPSPLAMMGLGLELAAAVAVPVVGGWWLDRLWNIKPALTLTGLLLGLTLMTWQMFRRL